MSWELPPKAKLIRRWLAPSLSSAFRHWLRLSVKCGACWVCRGDPRHVDRNGGTYDSHWGPFAPNPGGCEYSTLAYVKGRHKMGWKDSKDDAANRGAFVSLKDDGEQITFVALTEPVATEKEGFKKGTVRNVYRVIVALKPLKTESRALSNDLSIFAFNSYATTVGEGHEGKSWVTMTRHGSKGALDTRYSFKLGKVLVAAERKIVKAILKDLDVPF